MGVKARGHGLPIIWVRTPDPHYSAPKGKGKGLDTLL